MCKCNSSLYGSSKCNRCMCNSGRFGISSIVPYNFRNFSATNGKNKYLWLISSLDSEFYGILPCINGKKKRMFNNSLKNYLSSVINVGNKSLSYKLEYFLYLHTNDENKELIKGDSTATLPI